jgi:Raf kinase inhibitor-like YbhB/YbcL family protein
MALLQRSLVIICFIEILLGACQPPTQGSHLNDTTSSPKPALTPVKTMTLESNAFQANGFIPAKYTCNPTPKTATPGTGISPPLQWNTPPTGVKSLVLIVDDPDAPGGTFTHWVLYNLPATVRQLPEAVPTQPTLLQPKEINGAMQGKNDFGDIGYSGPCPPNGTHRYVFKLYALDQKLTLPASAIKAQVISAMDGHMLATAELVGRYRLKRE